MTARSSSVRRSCVRSGMPPDQSAGLRKRGGTRHRARLDAALADGADPLNDLELPLRAGRLVEQSTLKALANSLENIVDAAEEPTSAWRRGGPRPPLRRDAVAPQSVEQHRGLSRHTRAPRSTPGLHRGPAPGALPRPGMIPSIVLATG